MAECKFDPAWKSHATDREAEYIDAAIAAGTCRGAAAALGIAHQVLSRGIRNAKARYLAAQRQDGLTPPGRPGFRVLEVTTARDEAGVTTGEWRREGPEPLFEPGGEDAGPARDGGDHYVIKGVSTYFRGDGTQGGQWVKTKLDDQARMEMARAAIEAMSAEIPRAAPLSPPAASLEPLANLYTFTDYHMGMMAWAKEGGADWNVAIAETTLMAAFEHLSTMSPAARVGIINIQGDFLHSDGLLPVTPTHGHVLDQDGRFSRIVAATVRVIRRIVDLALLRHQVVHLVICEGNHDLASSLWLRHMFAALYELEPRLQVNESELPYYAYQHGRVMLAFHHGHLKKNDNLPNLFAALYAPMWGETRKRYCHTGHRHHEEVKEHAGMKVIQHPTLAAADAHSARGGWYSERQASVVTYHEEFGKVAEVVVTPEMLEPTGR